MMQNDTFRTPVLVEEFDKKIDYSSNIFSIGSCFSENIGNKLSDYRFQITTNPYGTLYNPISIFDNLSTSIKGKIIDDHKIVEVENVFRHFDFHSDISAHSLEELKSKINSTHNTVKKILDTTQFLFITLGTSFVFERSSDNEIVANCHKVPAKEFRQRLLTIDEIQQSFQKLYALLPKSTTIIFTVSPIRHFRNGLVDNSLSKSLLRYACHLFEEEHNNVHYFPSYEIMMDDLRDYRYYAEDMVHPSKLAIKYIWEQFKNSLIEENCYPLMRDWEKIIQGVNHRPFNPKTEAHQKFLRKLKTKALQIKKFKTEDIISIIDEQIIKQ
ncbi:GSCFA domain-containing protein [Flammeovirga agarivorans]|uniref:GSCFA domain-containing protein n=1 Tax=Flammeovirga agarivorans TaxID=2726742 RepID=A0A7X8SLY7_9BACT|nr:GSCFA domain-containing protein [Flammeovirga agarivorans]NLR92605.1 GSCFA domain-containing protein [Flammeovirga agarivorans]